VLHCAFDLFVIIAENIAEVRARIDRAARRAGRDPAEVQLMAVTKTQPADRIREAYESGLRVFGENRVQEYSRKSLGLRELPNAAWHMIGHLQTNKALAAVELFHAIDSVDSIRLAHKLNEAAVPLPRKLPILIEINVGGESAKHGLPPTADELEDLLSLAPKLDHLEIHGLMAVPPYSEDPEATRPYFRILRELRDSISARQLPQIRMDSLSMGMSHDFEVAIEEGSTCVRVGTAIFGERPAH
jgi:pyridoxal phosphate enzyme (YggS family)